MHLTIALVIATLWFEVYLRADQVPVELTHEKGRFTGTLDVSLTGTLQKARLEWNGSIMNTSGHQIHRVTFCVHAFDASDEQVKPGGDECVLKLWGTNWANAANLNFKGKQNIRIADGKIPVAVARYEIVAAEVFDRAPNLRTIVASCPAVWTSGLRTFADKKFRPTVIDKDSFTAAYAFEGGRVDNGSTQLLRAYTTANTGWTVNWDSFRIDSASFYLREEEPGSCTAEVKMSFAGFGKQMFGKLGWYALDSNFNFEKQLLDEIEAQAAQASEADLDRAIRSLPSEAVESESGLPDTAQLTITSEPAGAEIEIDGEFIGNTPSSVSRPAGPVTIRVTKSGYQQWERKLTVTAGDERTISVEMTK